MAHADRTRPELWDEVKREIAEGSKGGRPGQWSARKAQMAVQEYKRRGGGYDESGLAQDETDLHRWTEEDWGTRSGGESGKTGERYLPRDVRMLLTEDEYARSSRKKRNGRTQFVPQPRDVREKVAHIKKHGPTKQMLDARARDLGIDGRSKMDQDALLQAIREATDRNGRARGSAAAYGARSKSDLYDMARDRGIEGRSKMRKDELIKALLAAK